MSSKIHILGFPRIGLKRELKFSLEKFWSSGTLEDQNSLIKTKKDICEFNWLNQINWELDFITIGDFAYYDHVLNMLTYLKCIPLRFNLNFNNFSIKNYFEVAKGTTNQPPMEMTKWFNTNYHYLVPEYELLTQFSLNIHWLIEDIKNAKLLNYPIKIVLLGPISLLKLGKIIDNKLKNRLLLLPDLILIYINLLNKINSFNIELIQIDEPVLVINLSKIWINCFKNTYFLLSSYISNILLTTYFGDIKKYFNIINETSLLGLHLDLINNDQINYLINNSYFNNKILSLGVINGKNIWKTNLEKTYYILNRLKNKNIWISTSCSLLHTPIDIYLEKFIKKNIKIWLSFCLQKIKELYILKNTFNKKEKKLSKDFIKNIFYIEDKKKSKLIFNYKVQKIIKNLNNLDFINRENYLIRSKEQNNFLKLPILTTTTIGSFPQTKFLRKIRANYKKKFIKKVEYENFIKKEIKFIIEKQLKYNIDVLVHGEPERNDMVEYFAESLDGFLVTTYGWVQSYGSRCVKPPIIYGDVYLNKYITLDWLKYAQSLTNKFIKGMLTGPITIFKWSFARDDQPSYITSLQISLAIKKEVLLLEKFGIKIIQIDEPALREYLPLKKNNFKNYFNWSSKVFLLCCNKISNTTQIHTHICYSELKNILSYIITLDVDVISIETARSNMEILPFILNYPNEIGLGIYDIHTKRKLKINYAVYLIKLIISYISVKKIWINPDCGLKTRDWNDIEISLYNMTETAKIIRNNIKNND